MKDDAEHGQRSEADQKQRNQQNEEDEAQEVVRIRESSHEVQTLLDARAEGVPDVSTGLVQGRGWS